MKQVYYFYMDQCKGCGEFNEIYQEIVDYKLDDFEFEKINVMESMEFAKSLNVSNTPTLVMYDDSSEVRRVNRQLTKPDYIRFLFD